MTFRLLLAVAALAITASAATITNGTFDNSCAGWTGADLGSAGCQGTGGNPGGFFILNAGGDPLSDPSVSQSVTGLVIGQSYRITGDLRAAFLAVPVNNAFGAEIDGGLFQFNLTTPVFDWRSFSFDFTYAGGTSVLRFTGERNGSDADIAIDNIAIAILPSTGGGNIPEPSTWLLLTTASALGLVMRRRKRA